MRSPPKIEKKKKSKKNLEFKIQNLEFFFFSTFKSVKSPVSGKENVLFPDSPDFENYLNVRTGRDVQ